STSDHIMGILSAEYTLGRLASAFISMKLRPDIMISYHFVTLLAALSMLFFGRNDQMWITIGTAMLGKEIIDVCTKKLSVRMIFRPPCIEYINRLPPIGYGFSAMWPAMFAFTERHLRLTDRVCSLFSFLCGAVSLVIPLVLGQSFKSNPLILF